MSRYVVTGATGFLGGALTEALLSAGHEVTALGRNRDRLVYLRSLGALADMMELEEDVGNLANKFGTKPDAVIHCAALSRAWGPASAFERVNVRGTSRVVQAALLGECRHFVSISSPSIMFRLEDRLKVREDEIPPMPINAYARSKGAAEVLVKAADPMPRTILRPRAIYGIGDVTLLPRLGNACRRPIPYVNDGRAATDPTHVDDVVGAIRGVLDHGPPAECRTYNISGGVAVPIWTLIRRAAEKLGLTPRPWAMSADAALALARGAETFMPMIGRDPSLTRYEAGLLSFTQTLDLTAIRDVIGWTPKVDLEDGFRRTFA